MTKVAAAAYPLSPLADWAEYEAKLSRWVGEAAGAGAGLLLFPEYGGAESATLGGRRWGTDHFGMIDAITGGLDEANRILARLAASHGVHILTGSAPIREGGRVLNRAFMIGPEGGIAPVDKLMPTRWEREALGMQGGGATQVFETALGPIGCAICYDSEFPLVSRAQAEAGARILLVPSCTETEAGYWRVRIGAMARALESQFWVVHSPLIGTNDWAEMVETNVGAAGVYGPPDLGFPPTGVAALGGREAPGWVIHHCPDEPVERVRREGGVLNHLHWAEQDTRLATPERIALR